MDELKNIKSVLQASSVPCLIIDTKDIIFTIADTNESFSRIAKMELGEVVGLPMEKLFRLLPSFGEDEQQSIKHCLENVLVTKNLVSVILTWLPQTQFIERFEGQDFIDCDFYPVVGAAGEIRYIVQQFPQFYSASTLLNEKKKYMDLFNLSPLPQFLYDLDSLQFLDVNEAALKEYGYSKEEFLSMSLFDIRPAEDREFLKALIKEQVIKGQSNNSHVRHVRKDGVIMDVIVRGNSVHYNHKNARIAIIVDQTEKIRALTKLELSETRFKSLVQEGSDLIAIVTPEGKYNYVNPNSKSILGIESDYFIGKNVADFVHTDDLQTVSQCLNQVEDHKKMQLPPFRFKIGDNEYRWIETVVTNMITEPSIAGLIANSRDITERVNSETKMQESIERFNIVSKATSDAIWDWDMISDSMVWNKGLHGIFGYKMDHTEHKWWYDRIHEDDLERVKSEINDQVSNKQSRLELEYSFKANDGQYKNVLDRSFLIFDDSGNPVRMIGSMQDITERTTYLQEIQHQNTRLREISWMQSHNVRAPLARIMALINLLASADIDEETRERSLGYLEFSAAELNDVVYKIIKKTEKRFF